MKKQEKERKELQVEDVNGTPFKIVTIDEEKFIVCGKYKLPVEGSNEEIKEWVENKPWQLITLIAEVTAEFLINNGKKEENENTRN